MRDQIVLRCQQRGSQTDPRTVLKDIENTQNERTGEPWQTWKACKKEWGKQLEKQKERAAESEMVKQGMQRKKIKPEQTPKTGE